MSRSWSAVNTRGRKGRGRSEVVKVYWTSNRPNMAPKLFGCYRWCHVSLKYFCCTFTFQLCHFCHRKMAMCNLQFQSFKMFLNFWDVRLEISVVSAHVNLNGLMVHVKNRKMENRSAHWFWLTSIKQWRKCAAGKIAKDLYSRWNFATLTRRGIF